MKPETHDERWARYLEEEWTEEEVEEKEDD